MSDCEEKDLADRSLSALVAELDDIQVALYSYEHALGIMEYDGMTTMPPAGAALASRTQATLAAAQHEILTCERTGEVLAALGARACELDARHAAMVRVLVRRHREEKSVSAELAGDLRAATAAAFPVWRAAKENDDFASFEPYLGRIFALLREKARCIDPGKAPYDVCLDQWERGSSMKLCDAFFSQVTGALVPLIKEIAAQGPAPDFPFAHVHVPAATQAELGLDLARMMGLDLSRLTLGLTEHPWTTEFSGDDVRIAHHYDEHDVLDGVATSMHENGHALYEQRVDAGFAGTCLHRSSSGGIDEGQARLMENLVGHSRPFMDALLPLLRKHAPGAFDAVTPGELYRACNVVRPGCIRTLSDELTYPLHVLVRYECEKAMIGGDVEACDVPGLWRDLMREHLGVEVPDDAHGCLQDIHWSAGYIGYFPSYALGNAYGAQLVAHARRACPGFDASLACGDLVPLTSWLDGRVWKPGASIDPLPLMERACGESFDPRYYIDYLVEKFSALYGLG